MKEAVRGRAQRQLPPGIAELARIEEILNWVNRERVKSKLSRLRSVESVVLDASLSDPQINEELDRLKRISNVAVSETSASDIVIERIKAKAGIAHREVVKNGVYDPDEGCWNLGIEGDGLLLVQAYEPGREFVLGLEWPRKISKRLTANVNFTMTSNSIYNISVSFRRHGKKSLGYLADDNPITKMRSDHGTLIEEMFDVILGHFALPVVSQKPSVYLGSNNSHKDN